MSRGLPDFRGKYACGCWIVITDDHGQYGYVSAAQCTEGHTDER